MKRLISIKECSSYSRLLNLIESFKLDDDYIWLLTYVEAYPKNPELDLMLSENDYVFCTNKELISWLREEDFQWVWGVLSLFKPNTSKEDILSYKLPGIGDRAPRPHLYDDNKPQVQHKLAILELDADDSSFLVLSSREDKYIEIFKNLYPKSKENFDLKNIFY